jgi:hypothetical protein
MKRIKKFTEYIVESSAGEAAIVPFSVFKSLVFDSTSYMINGERELSLDYVNDGTLSDEEGYNGDSIQLESDQDTWVITVGELENEFIEFDAKKKEFIVTDHSSNKKARIWLDACDNFSPTDDQIESWRKLRRSRHTFGRF